MPHLPNFFIAIVTNNLRSKSFKVILHSWVSSRSTIILQKVYLTKLYELVKFFHTQLFFLIFNGLNLLISQKSDHFFVINLVLCGITRN